MKRRVFLGLVGVSCGCLIASLGAQGTAAPPATAPAKPPAAAPAKPPTAPAPKTYIWPGQVVSLDRTAETVTMKVACKPHIATYIDQFKPGQRIITYWGAPVDGEVQAINFVGVYDVAATTRVDDHGYVLPVELVSFDKAANAMTFKAYLNATGMSRFQAIQPGATVKVTSPLDQSGKGIAAITAVQPGEPAKPAAAK